MISDRDGNEEFGSDVGEQMLCSAVKTYRKNILY